MKSLFFALAFAASSALAGVPQPKVSFAFEPQGFRGDSTLMRVRVSLPEGWHIQSYAPLDSFLIPTVLRASGPGLTFGKAVYPKPKEEDFPALGGKVALYMGDFEIRVPVRRKSAKTDAAALRAAQVSLRYQACSSTQCLPPKEIAATFDPGTGKK